jgi:hypothetical protein
MINTRFNYMYEKLEKYIWNCNESDEYNTCVCLYIHNILVHYCNFVLFYFRVSNIVSRKLSYLIITVARNTKIEALRFF